MQCIAFHNPKGYILVFDKNTILIPEVLENTEIINKQTIVTVISSSRDSHCQQGGEFLFKKFSIDLFIPLRL